MSTTLVRVCDQCRKPVSDAAAVAMMRASIAARSQASVGNPLPIDLCSEPCAIAALRRLWSEATR